MHVTTMIETLTAGRSRRFMIRLQSNPEVQFSACTGRFVGLDPMDDVAPATFVLKVVPSGLVEFLSHPHSIWPWDISCTIPWA
jgi:hypothetical protein